MLRTTLSLFILMGTLVASSSQAQVTLNNAALRTPYSPLATLSGYQPSLVASEQSAASIYRLLPTSIFKGDSGCYQRAHIWANQLNNQYGLKSMKVFLFFSERYRREFAYKWVYHVAPLIPVQKADGSIEELVFDPTFTSAPSWASPRDRSLYDNKPVSIEQWARYFIFPNVQCKVVNSFKEYFENQDQYYCFVMKAPMYNYSPEDFDGDAEGSTGSRGADWFNASTGVRNGFRIGDINNMSKALIDN